MTPGSSPSQAGSKSNPTPNQSAGNSSGQGGTGNNVQFNGKTVTQDNSLFDPNTVDTKGRTNIQRMEKGLSPIGSDGKSINIHHTDQTNTGPFQEILQTDHHKPGLHQNTGQSPSMIERSAFNQWRNDYWKWRSNDFKE
jgi:hypothetical protein